MKQLGRCSSCSQIVSLYGIFVLGLLTEVLKDVPKSKDITHIKNFKLLMTSGLLIERRVFRKILFRNRSVKKKRLIGEIKVKSVTLFSTGRNCHFFFSLIQLFQLPSDKKTRSWLYVFERTVREGGKKNISAAVKECNGCDKGGHHVLC